MTDIRNGQLTDLLLNESEYNTEIQALAYAMHLEKQRILDELLEEKYEEAWNNPSCPFAHLAKNLAFKDPWMA